MTKIIFSIIIPAPKFNSYLEECVNAIMDNTVQDFEIIIILNEKTNRKFPKTKFIYSRSSPAEKRDLAVKVSKGKYLAFIDDDAYPSANWLKSTLPYLAKKNITAVGGPGVTPPHDNFLQRVSGWVSATFPGSLFYTYRFIPQKEREVDDYPSMNFIVNKKDFLSVGGFDTNYWPGEDTKLCLDLTQKLHKKILYSPDILVYHHRRPIFKAHLIQNGRYGFQRGYFAKVLPQTSFRIGYFLPSLLFLYSLFIVFSLLFSSFLFLILSFPLGLYFILVSIFSIFVFLKEKNIIIALLYIPAVYLTHVYYGYRFLKGYFHKQIL